MDRSGSGRYIRVADFRQFRMDLQAVIFHADNRVLMFYVCEKLPSPVRVLAGPFGSEDEAVAALDAIKTDNPELRSRTFVSTCQGSDSEPNTASPPDQATVAVVIESLTETQRLICLMCGCGMAQKRIALLLDMGLRSVELEKQRVAKQLGLETTQVALWAAVNLEALEANLENSELLTPEISNAICGGSNSLINAGIVKAAADP